MRKAEQLLWDSFKRNAPSQLDLQRVENLVGDGMPDVYVGYSGKWVELKAPPTIPVRPGTPLLGTHSGLRQSQINWHLKHCWNGIAPRSYILVRTSDRELILLPGGAADIINGLPLIELRTYRCALGTWPDIMEALK